MLACGLCVSLLTLSNCSHQLQSGVRSHEQKHQRDLHHKKTNVCSRSPLLCQVFAVCDKGILHQLLANVTTNHNVTTKLNLPMTNPAASSVMRIMTSLQQYGSSTSAPGTAAGMPGRLLQMQHLPHATFVMHQAATVLQESYPVAGTSSALRMPCSSFSTPSPGRRGPSSTSQMKSVVRSGWLMYVSIRQHSQLHTLCREQTV